MANLEVIRVIVARERGYIRTSVACKRLDMTITDLLALRRRLICSALGVRKVPRLAAVEVERALLPGEPPC